jgi:hypothetical protein
MSDWPKYQSHKIVQAAKIVGFDADAGGKPRAIVHGPDGAEGFVPTVPAMLDKAEVGDWAMLYPDGYRSISPAKQFEEGYMPCP